MPITVLTHRIHTKNVGGTDYFKRGMYLRANAEGQNIHNIRSSHHHRDNTEKIQLREEVQVLWDPSVILRISAAAAPDIPAKSQKAQDSPGQIRHQTLQGRDRASAL